MIEYLLKELLRESLFRAKSLYNGEWIEGDLVHEPYGIVLQYYKHEINEDGEDSERRIKESIDPETICPYTGLTDHTKWEKLSEEEKQKFLSKWNYTENRQNTKEDWNGRKIFEGDVIEDIDYGYMCCMYKDGTFIWYSEKEFGIKFMLYVPTIEIIGNIFDNPELIGDSI